MAELPDSQRCPGMIVFGHRYYRCELTAGHEERHSFDEVEDTGTSVVTLRWG